MEAVLAAGEDVVGVLFDNTWLAGAGWGDALLFAPGSWPTEGGAYFDFLSDLWRRYPNHWVVLVTDGDGYVPYASAPDRARTGAVVIPDGNRPNLGLAKMAEICNSVIVLKDPRDLPWAMALLIPRATVAYTLAGLTSRHRGLTAISARGSASAGPFFLPRVSRTR